MTLQTTVRPARAEDLDGIVAVFHACWQVNYSPVLPAEVVAAMTLDRSRELWIGLLTEVTGGILVAERSGGGGDSGGDTGDGDRGGDGSGSIVGVTRFTVEGDGSGAVQSLYVSPESQGEGTGRLLLDAAVDALAEQAAVPVRLWVFAANAPSLAFYWARGWKPNGRTRIEEAFGEPELQLQLTAVRDLQAGVAP